MDEISALLGRLMLGEPAAYDVDKLPAVIALLRETQGFLELRYSHLRKATADRVLATASVARRPSGKPTDAPQRKRGRPAGANGHKPPAAEPVPPPLPFEGQEHVSEAID